jgi:peptidoglycan/LPS O-acetylase OafA/YrhL
MVSGTLRTASLPDWHPRSYVETAMATSTLPANVAARHDVAARAPTGFHPEIQGLRAVAVLLVVLFHLWPGQLSGGFVGVDVFFVISGYLITAHIYRELAATRTLSIRRFWARRIRRLLPASLLVLSIIGGATILFLPATIWVMTARQIAASALYVQNWMLASDAVDYLAKDNVATAAQHYWSLSVEEQFYVFWPLFILGLIVLAGRGRRPLPTRTVLIVGLGAAGAGSLVWSIVYTASDTSIAYFATPTRVWEFVAGALLAIVVIPGARAEIARSLVGWLGLAAIVAAALLFDTNSLFPGWIALLPVLGAVAVIAAGGTLSRYSAGWWLSRRPLTFVGDVSYSVYLWHWPLIIIMPHITGVDLRTFDKIGILVATIVLAWLSKTFVEDPMRTKPFLCVAPWRSFAFAAAGMVVVVAITSAITGEITRRVDAAMAAQEIRTYPQSDCFGPAALDPAYACDPVTGSHALVPPPEVVTQENERPAYRGCQQTIAPATVKVCAIGSEDPRPDRVVAIVGDSHATHWFAAFDRLGREQNWKILTFTKASCPATNARRVLPDEPTDEAQRSCHKWAAEVRHQIAADEEISYVFTSSYSTAYDFAEDPSRPLDDPSTEGFQQIWKTWVSDGKDVFVIRDIPPTQGKNVPDCLAMNAHDRLACATSAYDIPDDPGAEAAVSMEDPRVHLIDLTTQFCDATTCYPVVGDLIVYRDGSHLSGKFSEALAPYISAQVDQIVGTSPEPVAPSG